ncbi:MAG: type II toxin-antitoxin system RelE/ParE family toxin [bacterium]|nr:type II toxin-antitoxin system RelE/ParE family toxin [bacterium]
MIFEVLYEQNVAKEDIPNLPKKAKERVRNAIEQKLTAKPDVFGKPLRKSLKGYRSLRIGDYRVIYRIEKRTVKIFAIKHRSVVYQNP